MKDVWVSWPPRSAEKAVINTIFRDTGSQRCEKHYVRERKMLIGEQCFHFSSKFPSHLNTTPTDKMLELIDAELKKDTRAERGFSRL